MPRKPELLTGQIEASLLHRSRRAMQCKPEPLVPDEPAHPETVPESPPAPTPAAHMAIVSAMADLLLAMVRQKNAGTAEEIRPLRLAREEMLAEQGAAPLPPKAEVSQAAPQ